MKTKKHKKLSIKELLLLLKVDDQTVRGWCRAGMPSSKIGGKLAFDRAVVGTWLVQHGKAKHAAKLFTGTSTGQAVENLAKMDGMTIADTLERLKRSELDCWTFYQQADTGGKAYWMEQHRNASEQRRKVEKDLAEIQLSQSDVVPLAEVSERVSMATTAFKNSMMGIGNSIAPLCEGKTAGEIVAIIDNKTREIFEKWIKDLEHGSNK